MKKLAHIEIIKNIKQIQDAKNIASAQVLNKTVIVSTNEYTEGEKVVFCETGTVLPRRKEFDFLKKNNFEIVPKKMYGVTSYGVCFPLSILPNSEYTIGQDVTDLIGISTINKSISKSHRISTKERNIIIAIICILVVLMSVPIISLLLNNKKDDINVCSSCHKTFTNRADTKSIAYTSMCEPCYENFKFKEDMKEEIHKMKERGLLD